MVSEADAATLLGKGGLQRERFDERWVACGRPVAVAGGELTLEMLDLQHNPDTKFYDAPLHVKALNGMLLVDDFGRQKFDPNELLNRWIVPMENQIDYLKLNTGTSFSLPFDELLVFSTNLQPSDLMDRHLCAVSRTRSSCLPRAARSTDKYLKASRAFTAWNWGMMSSTLWSSG